MKCEYEASLWDDIELSDGKTKVHVPQGDYRIHFVRDDKGRWSYARLFRIDAADLPTISLSADQYELLIGLSFFEKHPPAD